MRTGKILKFKKLSDVFECFHCHYNTKLELQELRSYKYVWKISRESVTFITNKFPLTNVFSGEINLEFHSFLLCIMTNGGSQGRFSRKV